MSDKNLPPAPAPFEATPALEQFMDKHFKSVVLAVVIVVVGLCAYAFLRYQGHKKEQEAGAAFVTAKTVADCDLVVQNYPGTEAAGNALLLKADLLWAENKKDSSTGALREYIDKYGEHPFLPEGILGLATKLDSMGERAEAKPLFERLVNQFPTSAVAPLAQIRLGDLLWAEGKEDEAKKAYEAVPAKFTDANQEFFAQAEERIKLVEAKLPTKEVDGPPKPKVPEPVPGAPPPGIAPPKFNIPGLAPTITPVPGGTESKVELATPPGMPVPSAAPAAPPSLGTPGVTTPAPTLPAPKAAPAVVPPAVPTATPAPAPAPSTPTQPTSATPAPAPATAPAPAAPTPPAAPAPAPAAAPTPPPAPAPAPTPPPPPAATTPGPAVAPAPEASPAPAPKAP